MEDKLKMRESCVCICPPLYNDFSSCSNYSDGLCGKAIIQNIDFARDLMLRRQDCVVDVDMEKEHYKRMNLSAEDVDRRILRKLYMEKENYDNYCKRRNLPIGDIDMGYSEFREFCQREHPNFENNRTYIGRWLTRTKERENV